MSKKLPALKLTDVISALEKTGFIQRRQTGSHVIMFKSGVLRSISVPVHSGEIAKGTLRAIIRQAGLSVDEFISRL